MSQILKLDSGISAHLLPRKDLTAQAALLQHRVASNAERAKERQSVSDKIISEQEPGEAQKKFQDKVEKSVQQFNDLLDIFNRELHLEIHDETEQPFVQVINIATQRVIRSYPPEEFLDLVARLRETISLFFDEKA